MLPLILKVREGYYSFDKDYTLNASGQYSIPTRAVGGKVDTVALVDGTRRLDLVRYFENELYDTSLSPESQGFYIKRSKIITLPKVPNGYPTLRVGYMLRPAKIIATTDAAQITGIDTGTKTVTLSSIPSNFSTSLIYDIVQAEPHFDTLGIDLVATQVTSTTITFSDSLPDDLVVGDWVSIAGTTPVIQVPVELQPLLEQYVANTCLKSQTDLEAYKAGVLDAKTMRDDVLSLITPRAQGEGKKLVNRTGMLRRGL